MLYYSQQFPVRILLGGESIGERSISRAIVLYLYYRQGDRAWLLPAGCVDAAFAGVGSKGVLLALMKIKHQEQIGHHSG